MEENNKQIPLGVLPKLKRHFPSFRRWLVVQKVTLGRGYSWLSQIMIGFIAIGSIKTIFPNWADTIPKVAIWFFVTVFGLWFVGYIDKRLRLYHEESAYGTEVNPLMMEVVDNTRKKEDGNTNKEKHN